MTKLTDSLALTCELVAVPSVTPDQGPGLDVIESWLVKLGFDCERLPFGEGSAKVDNLYARRGRASPHLLFVGHSDVVPAGDVENWRGSPFTPILHNGTLQGRGVADMKGAIACYVAAIARLDDQQTPLAGSLSLFITGDEEGAAIHGSKPALAKLSTRGEVWDGCITGEPTNPERMGQMMKIGRRGSLHGRVLVQGVQGHTGYPHLADNPVHRAVALAHALVNITLDKGNEHFQPSSIALTSFDVGNTATNVIPAEASFAFNIRYNNHFTASSLTELIEKTLAKASVDGKYRLSISNSGESFLTEPGDLSETLGQAIHDITGETAELSTSGGTSDSRFVQLYCPVVDFGLVGKTMHKINEQVDVADLETLTQIYGQVIQRFCRVDSSKGS